MNEPHATAIVLTILGVLMALSVAASRLAGRMSVPVAFLFLAVGMLAGSDWIGRIAFENYALAFRLGTISLVLILFDGGLNTSPAAVRRAWAPSSVLALFGTVGTAALMGVGAHLIGFSWPSAFLLGAIVSPTDAAAVFSVLRGSRVELTRRVATTLELESGLNDPIAVILTLALTRHEVGSGRIALELAIQIVVGLAVGLFTGWAARLVIRRLRPAALGLLPVFTVAIAFASFGGATLLQGSGFLAAYVAALTIGAGPLPYRSGLLRVHDSLAWLAQVVMFLVLGLLSFPSRLWAVAPAALLLGLVLAFVARPLATALCLIPFRYRAREWGYVGWVGLRGAVPIILAIFPILAHAPEAEHIFDVVFFIVVVSAVIPGATVRRATKFFGVDVKGTPPPSAVLEIASTRPLHADLMSFYIEPASAVAHARVSELPFPAGAALMLIVRGDDLLAVRGDSTLEPGDHVYVFCKPEDRGMIRLLFGPPEEE